MIDLSKIKKYTDQELAEIERELKELEDEELNDVNLKNKEFDEFDIQNNYLSQQLKATPTEIISQEDVNNIAKRRALKKQM